MRYLVLLSGLMFLLACGRDRLENEYKIFEGSYDWISTGASKTAWNHVVIDPDKTGYTVQLELDDDGHIRFFKGQSLISEHEYRIVDRETNQYGGAMIMVQLKGETGHLSLDDDRLTLRMSGDTGLWADRFPFPAIDRASTYYPEYTSNGNSFHR